MLCVRCHLIEESYMELTKSEKMKMAEPVILARPEKREKFEGT